MLHGGADALIIETCQDLLQAKAASIGAKRAVTALARRRSSSCAGHGTTGTMLLGRTSTALTALEPLGMDMIGVDSNAGTAR